MAVKDLLSEATRNKVSPVTLAPVESRPSPARWTTSSPWVTATAAPGIEVASSWSRRKRSKAATSTGARAGDPAA